MSLDDEIRDAERAHEASGTMEDRDRLRSLLFRAGRDPFPRQIWTPEWDRAFSLAPKPGIHAERCGCPIQRGGTHSCPHDGPTMKSLTSAIPWSQEAVSKLGWIDRREDGDAWPDHMRGIMLCSGLGLDDGCSLVVHIQFHPGAEVVEVSHRPCPIERRLQERYGREGRSLTIRPSSRRT